MLLAAALFLQSQEMRSGIREAMAEAAEDIGEALPGGSQGGGYGDETEGGGSEITVREFRVMTAVRALTDMSLPVVAVNSQAQQEGAGNPAEGAADDAALADNGEILVSSQEKDGDKTGGEGEAAGNEPSAAENEGQQEQSPPEEDIVQADASQEQATTPVAITDSVKTPSVLIYHTHTTESYQPVSVGNFHSVDKEGTVRQVGDALAARLEELGYTVIHDETIHDNPSYNQSYSRSLATAKEYLAQYPKLALVIDLHRDAAGYAGSVGKTVSIEGKTAATYGYVIGQGNPNVQQLTQTVKDLNQAAEALYPNFTGKIIEKDYKFNQYISDHHVLIEVGNNENTIEQAKLTGYYLADIIAEYLKNSAQ